MLLQTSEITLGERLRVLRRRQNLTQAKAAAYYGAPLGAYKAAEKDAASTYIFPSPSIGKLQPFEACEILRRRKGLTLDELAANIGRCKWWVCLMEQGKAPADILVAFWT